MNAFITAGMIWIAGLLPVCIQAGENAPLRLVGQPMPNHPPLYTVQFGFGSDSVTASHRRALQTLVQEIQEHDRGRPMTVTGFTDDTGPKSYNERLARRRAEAVKKVLIDAGIPAPIVSTEAIAKGQYLSPNQTVEGRADNRRAELHWTEVDHSDTESNVRTFSRYSPRGNGGNGSGAGSGSLHRLSADDLRVGRYSEIASDDGTDQSDPLSTLIDVTFPALARSIGGALSHILRPNGWQLATPLATDPEANRLFTLPLPESQHQLGHLSVISAMKALCGAGFLVVTDPVHRLASCELAPAYAAWRDELEATPEVRQ
ncbi:MAG: OmpA family protein [Candidatus Sedimenticola endophacoides]